MARLSVQLLGTLQVKLGGISVTDFESDKERALLAYLAEESQQPHHRDKLVGLLWPDSTESAGRNNLRRVLSNLRRVIGDRDPVGQPLLGIGRQTIQFNRAADVWVDVQVFHDLLGQAEQEFPDPLEKAIALYQGEFLEGFSLAGSPEFEDWIVLCRERYRRLMMGGLRRLVEGYQEREDYEHALQHAWTQVEIEPWWEEAHRRLMLLLALSGRRGEALDQYGKCLHVLAKELDVTPSIETTELYEQIKDGSLTAPSPSRRSSARPSHNLPFASGLFVGREPEIAEILEQLQDRNCRLLTLVGQGGMGKTRLALEAVTRWMSLGPDTALDGVTLVPLAPVRTRDAVATAIAQAAGFALTSRSEPQRQLLDVLSNKRWLLILDGMEHLPDARLLVAEILRTTPLVKVLATSRTRLDLQDEFCLSVAGIEYPRHILEDAQSAEGFPAVQLFLQASRQVQHRLEPTDKDVLEIARVCRLVQGMPLGILLAATWSNVLSPAEIAAEIEKGFDFLESSWADVPERHRSIRSVFDGSWDLLTGKERDAFQALSVFSGGFTREAAEEVSGASVHMLRTLAQKALVQVTPTGRYQIHELLRQYAAERLQSLPDAAMDARDRHCDYYAASLKRWGAEPTMARRRIASLEMEREIGNIGAAWAWAVERGRVQQLDSGMDGLENFYWHSGRFREGANALEAAARASEEAAGSASDRATCLRVWARALAWQSNFLRATGQKGAAQKLQQKCQEILDDPALEGTDTRLERAILSWSIGLTICMSDYALGRERFEESFSLFAELGHRWGIAWALAASADMSKFLGAYGIARQRLEEAAAIYAQGDQQELRGSLPRLAEIAWRQGRFEESERLARAVLAGAQESASRTYLAGALLNLGEVLEKVGKFNEAHSALQQSLDLYSEIGHRHYITEAHTCMGSTDLHRGRYEDARDHLEVGLALAREQGPQYCIAECLFGLGCLHYAQGAFAEAFRLLSESAAQYKKTGPPDSLGMVLACKAAATHGLGDRSRSMQNLGDALRIILESEAVQPLLWVLPVAAVVLAGRGEHERATELYSEVSRYPFVARSRWFESLIGEQIASLSATPPPDRVIIAENHNKVGDLKAVASELLSEFDRSFSPA